MVAFSPLSFAPPHVYTWVPAAKPSDAKVAPVNVDVPERSPDVKPTGTWIASLAKNVFPLKPKASPVDEDENIVDVPDPHVPSGVTEPRIRGG